MKKIYSLAILLLTFNSYAQIKNNGKPTDNGINSATAFIDASSSVEWNKSTNIGKGLVFPRTDLTKLKSLAAPVNGLPASFPTRLDGMIVYNTANGTSGIGKTAVTPGFYYYKNDSKDLNGGTWVRISDTQAAANLYTQDGTLTDNRTVNLDNKNLAFTGDGNVGIGVDNPSEKLEVEGIVKSNYAVKISRNKSEAGPYLQLENPLKTTEGSGKQWRIYNMTGVYPNSLQFWAYNDKENLGSKMMLTDAGNVGIGTPSREEPTAKLDVNGNVRIRTIKAGNPTTDEVLLADANGNIKKAEANSLSKNIYTNNGVLTDNREVNLDNKNLSFTNGQIGINTKEPRATLEITKSSSNINGILIPRLTTDERENMNNSNPDTGLLIYNTDRECFESNIGTPNNPEWDCLAMQGKSQKIFIKPYGVEGSWVKETDNNPDTNKIKFKVINKSTQALNNIDFSYVQLIKGCCADVLSGQNTDVTVPAQDSVILTYKVGGTTWADALQFSLAYDQNVEGVLTISGTDTGTYDSNTGTYQGNGGSATIGEYTHKLFSVNELIGSTQVNKEITITNDTPLVIEVPYTDGLGNYEAETTESPTFNDKQGNPRKLQLSIDNGYFANSTGVLKVTIKPQDGQPITLPQTQLGNNAPIIGIPININGNKKGTLQLVAYGGIKDRHFGDGEHDFVYADILAEDGTTWLNNNLGAEYTNIHSSVFNPMQQVKNLEDINGYGSTFDFGRAADGHELMIVKNGALTPKYGYTEELATTYQPDTKLRIVNPERNLPNRKDRKYTWVIENLDPVPVNTLWAKDGENNPCPTGYEVPTRKQLNNIIRYTPQKSANALLQGKLKLISDTAVRNYARLIANNSMLRVFGVSTNFFYLRCIKAQ